MTEKFLLYRIRTKRDSDAFGELYDGYVERIYRFIYFKISNREEAEDLTSDVFLKLWNYLIDDRSRRPDVKSVSGLAYAIARNTVVDWYRDRAKKQEQALIEELVEPAAADIVEKLHTAYDADQLLRVIKTLKQEYQEVILLRFIEELSITEIADVIGKKKTAVRVTLHRAVKKLREMTGTRN
ncbi:MAG: hypothetical protein A3C90_02065 [Candidatus Magasanikbacteria bacterium RIFCSPHIGHO2_02_FULL_51_14]|uniref:RNA polymerase sigma factor 70 region 4 type 2 domain-containing protein n=1 Tax=Candidatus Magasanikbacteria bacterium RIFCSPHIGHO2_02_FULL_51_14 TaxID=1798683 RepID=A0A1F6MDS7_9BACT|nr:MAG: hypothetical protein A3C90_02065 [Candidatus Magasanikbacteria bacterium RIFCSPHIGHO2_02_FULL_51_14]